MRSALARFQPSRYSSRSCLSFSMSFCCGSSLRVLSLFMGGILQYKGRQLALLCQPPNRLSWGLRAALQCAAKGILISKLYLATGRDTNTKAGDLLRFIFEFTCYLGGHKVPLSIGIKGNDDLP